MSNDKRMELPPDVAAKLKRLEQLESDLAKEKGEGERLRQQLIERGMQPDQHGIKTVTRTFTRIIKKPVKKKVFEKEQRIVKDKDGVDVLVEVPFEVERDVLVEVPEEYQEDRYLIKIDLPPSGGTQLLINGVPYYHGSEYEFDFDQLCSVREMIARSWAHEQNIKGSDENAYRPQLKPVLNARRNFAR